MTFKLYCCGSNGKFQLGNGTDEDIEVPELVFQAESAVKKVVCGGNHSLILLLNGELYASGDNSRGQCGIEAPQFLEKFTKIGGKWKDCSAGYEYSIFVGSDDEVYSCGYGQKGELGLGEGITQSLLRRIDIQLDSEVSSVKSCLDHSALLTSAGGLYVWGNGRNGKLIEIKNKVWSPEQIQSIDFKVLKFELGRDFTLLSDFQNIKLFGKDRYGISEGFPSKFQDFKTMWSSVHFLDNSKIISLGNNSHGQILDSVEQIQFDDFQVGSEHGLLISSNAVHSWGWGEHGNCGPKTTESDSFRLTKLFEPGVAETVVKVQGGCATSWIITATE